MYKSRPAQRRLSKGRLCEAVARQSHCGFYASFDSFRLIEKRARESESLKSARNEVHDGDARVDIPAPDLFSLAGNHVCILEIRQASPLAADAVFAVSV